MPARAWEFAVGIVLAVVLRSRSLRSPLLSTGIGLIGLAAIVWSGITLADDDPFPGMAAVPSVLGAGAIIAAGSGGRGIVSRALSVRPAVRLGDVSYGLYLWHWPLIVAARASLPDFAWAPAAAVLLSLGLAWLSFIYLEQPIQSGSVATRPVLLAVGCAAVPLLAMVGLRQWESEFGHRPDADDFAWHLDLREGCDSGSIGVELDKCFWPADGQARGLAVLVGDSNAGHFSEAFLEAASQLGFDAAIRTRSGCPLAHAHIVRGNSTSERCDEQTARWWEFLDQHEPDLVVMSNASDVYVSRDRIRIEDWPRRGVAEDSTDRERLWTEALSATYDLIEAPILLVNTVPRLNRSYDPKECSMAWFWLSNCSSSRSRSDAEKDRAPALRAENGSADGRSDVMELDLIDVLCGRSVCESHKDGVPLFRDAFHLSVPAAAWLEQPLVEAMGKTARLTDSG